MLILVLFLQQMIQSIDFGTTTLSFSQFSGHGSAGDGLTKSGNILNVNGGNGITANANDH